MFDKINFHNDDLQYRISEQWISSNGMYSVILLVQHKMQNGEHIGYTPLFVIEKRNAKGEFVSTKAKLPKYVQQVIEAGHQLVEKLNEELYAMNVQKAEEEPSNVACEELQADTIETATEPTADAQNKPGFNIEKMAAVQANRTENYFDKYFPNNKESKTREPT